MGPSSRLKKSFTVNVSNVTVLFLHRLASVTKPTDATSTSVIEGSIPRLIQDLTPSVVIRVLRFSFLSKNIFSCRNLRRRAILVNHPQGRVNCFVKRKRCNKNLINRNNSLLLELFQLTVPIEQRMAFLIMLPKSSMKSIDVAKGSMAQQMMYRKLSI